MLKAGGGLILVAGAGGALVLMTPREARDSRAGLRALSQDEGRTMEALGETLLPGAREAGILHFVDSQLAAAPADSLLILRYFDWPPPYADFYKGGLAALDGLSRVMTGRRFAALTAAKAAEVVGAMASGQAKAWQGPPAQLFYMCARSDAVDVVYGTLEGFQKLGVPYMAHIEPDEKW